MTVESEAVFNEDIHTRWSSTSEGVLHWVTRDVKISPLNFDADVKKIDPRSSGLFHSE